MCRNQMLYRIDSSYSEKTCVITLIVFHDANQNSYNYLYHTEKPSNILIDGL